MTLYLADAVLTRADAVLTRADIVHLLLSLAALLGLARLLGEVARRLHQPMVIGEILAGIILGPTCLGYFFPREFALVFPTAGPTRMALEGMVTLGVLMLLLVAGLEVDLSTALRRGKTAILVSLTGMIIPFTIGLTVAWFLGSYLGSTATTPAQSRSFALFIGIALSITALPVIAKILMDINLLQSDLGILIISAAMIDDLVGWIGFALVLALLSQGNATAGSAGGQVLTTILLTLTYLGLMLTLGRWLIDRALPAIQARTSWPGGVIGFVLVITLLAAAYTEWIGVHAIFGAFIAGVAIGDSSHLRERTRDTIHQFITHFFAPIFFASIGLRVNFWQSFDPLIVVVVLVVALASKVGGCYLGAKWAGMERREGLAVGFGMAARGAMEIILAQLARQYELIGDKTLVAIIIMAMITSLISGPMMEMLLRRRQRRRLVDYFSEKNYIPELQAHNVQGAITELAQRAAQVTGLEAEAITQAVWQREQLMHTGYGEGLAAPHARLATIAKPAIIFARSTHGVDFDASDGEPARIITLILTPLKDQMAQIEILRLLASAFSRPGIRQSVLEAENATHVLAALNLAESEELDIGRVKAPVVVRTPPSV